VGAPTGEINRQLEEKHITMREGRITIMTPRPQRRRNQDRVTGKMVRLNEPLMRIGM